MSETIPFNEHLPGATDPDLCSQWLALREQARLEELNGDGVTPATAAALQAVAEQMRAA